MLRVSKLTDYTMVIMALIGHDQNRIFCASEVAQATTIAKPTVSKLLKQLAKHGYLRSQRGATGGYQMAKRPEDISVVELIQIQEGPLALTECNLGTEHCAVAAQCAIRAPWQQINQVVHKTLASITLSDLIHSRGAA